MKQPKWLQIWPKRAGPVLRSGVFQAQPGILNEADNTEVRKQLPMLLIGHSHMQCVISNEDIWSNSTIVQQMRNRHNVYVLKGRNPRDDEYWSRAIEIGSAYRIFIFFGGSEHYSSFLIRQDAGFDFYCEEAPHLILEPGVPIVPSAIVEAFFQQSIEPLSHVLRSLADVRACCTVVGSPPPKALNNAEIKQRMEVFFLDQAKRMGLTADQIVLNTPTLMLKLWHVQATLQKKMACRHNFRYISPPRGCVDDLGFLKSLYWQADITHANETYGEKLLEAMSQDHE